MGLDMYLSTNSKKACRAAQKASGTEEWRFGYGDAIYWRKANHIHKWFVDHVQGGNDDCGTYPVEVDQLIELRDACRKVLEASKLVDGEVCVGEKFEGGEWVKMTQPGKVIEDPSVAEEILPTESGFFFGMTEYDEDYFEELVRTAEGIDAILENVERFKHHTVGNLAWDEWREKGDPDEWIATFSYHASW